MVMFEARAVVTVEIYHGMGSLLGGNGFNRIQDNTCEVA